MEAEGGYAWRLAAVTMEGSRCVKEDGGRHCLTGEVVAWGLSSS